MILPGHKTIMNNTTTTNFIVWASVSLIQLLMLDAHNSKLSSLRTDVKRLSEKVKALQSDLDERLDKQVVRHLINNWESDEEFDSR